MKEEDLLNYPTNILLNNYNILEKKLFQQHPTRSRLNFNHPVKEIVWVAQKTSNVELLQGYNYTDIADSSPLLTTSPLGSTLLQGIAENLQVMVLVLPQNFLTRTKEIIHVVLLDYNLMVKTDLLKEAVTTLTMFNHIIIILEHHM